MVLQQQTFMFADLCDFTDLAWRHGDEWAADVALAFHRLVRELTCSACEIVKTIGDAVMIRSTDPLEVVRLAQAIHRGAAAAVMPGVHIGIDSGSAVQRGGDWYGTTVNTAARVCQEAGQGEMWMTERTAEAIRGQLRLTIVERGHRALKGLPACVLHAALDAGELEPLLPVLDPALC